jgi:hypothetical protein
LDEILAFYDPYTKRWIKIVYFEGETNLFDYQCLWNKPKAK